MELIYYTSVLLLSFFFALRSQLFRSDILFFIFWLLVYTCLSIIVRSEFEVDILTYSAAMSSQSLSIYFLREPIVWLGQRLIFDLTSSEFTTFLIFDVFAGLVLFFALRRLLMPQYFYFSILVFFPFVLGMQNVYRQWVSAIFFLAAFALVYVGSARIKSWVLFTLCVASHNVGAVFLPLLFINKNRILAKLTFFAAFLIAFIGIYLGADSKSQANTGLALGPAYLFLFLVFLIVYVVLDRAVIKRSSRFQYRFITALIVIGSFSSIVLSSSGAERVMMFGLIVFFPFLALKFEQRLKHKFAARCLLSFCGFFPIFLSGTRQFLL